MINLLISRINQSCSSEKEKDLLSLGYIIWFLLYLFIFVIPLLIQYINEFLIQFYNYWRNPLWLGTDIFSFNKIFKVVLIGLIPVISRKIFKKINFKSELLVVIISTVGLVIICNNYIFSVIICLLFVLILSVIPYGESKYFNLIINIGYLEEICRNYIDNNKISKKNIYKKLLNSILVLTLLIALIVSIAILLSYYMRVSFIYNLIILFTLTCLLYLYKDTKDKIITLLKKIIIFSIFLFISLYANRIVPNNLEKVLLLIITIYFSLDRIVSLGKDIQDIIKKYSIVYYYENKYLSIQEIKKEYLEIKFINNYEIEEPELIKQIILRQRLSLLDELIEICSLYLKKDFKSYKQFVEYTLYRIKKDIKKETDLKYEEKELKRMINIGNQKIFLIELYKEYASNLYIQRKFNEAIKIYEDILLHLNIKELEIMYQCYLKLEEEKKANFLKKNYFDIAS